MINRKFYFKIGQPFGKLTSLPDEIRPLENKMLWKEDLSNLAHPYFKETIGLAASLGNCYIFRKVKAFIKNRGLLTL